MQNDMIGPLGYGDAHFVSADQAYDYTIRYENDPNATAPAQIVVVTHVFDRDLDIRTFRLGSLGFGGFTREISYNTAVLQVSSYSISMNDSFFIIVHSCIIIIGGCESDRESWCVCSYSCRP